MSVRLEQLLAAATEFTPGYVVTFGGRIFSMDSNWRGYGPRELAQSPNSDGYLRVRCNVLDRVRFPAEVVRRSFFVHKVVAEAYLPAPLAGQQLRHLNGDKTDNRASNLAWGTAAENAADRDAHGRTARGSRNGFAKLSEEDVREIRMAYATGAGSTYELAKAYDVSASCIQRAINGDRWAHV